ncbi:MAG: Holliday junction resolvase RuvX [Planctomycetaceae bacterium]|nr:Holliday junction resolvase RuvX [Planctomycetaceae bacterium]HAA70812.1 Holliday junction resolvase RuvX [Planctomycetaceae bacterium]|tara:strand:- start:5517 stop:5981 length:465 start_codon:yes stop_codon:yes gene_type:complete
MDFPVSGRLAGIDYGTVRVGIAVTDTERIVASPLQVYRRVNSVADQRFFRALAEDEALVGWVVGLPVHTSGDESQKSREARHYGQWLAEVTELPVRFFDERYTSQGADQLLLEGALTGRRRKLKRDMVAAQIMLSAYLEFVSMGKHGEGTESWE